MKISIGSDLHLEFGTFEPSNIHGADVLILSGDICVAEDLHMFPVDYASNYVVQSRSKNRALDYRVFFRQCAAEFKHVVYVAGNHEFYHGKFHGHLDILRKEVEDISNMHFLEDDKVEIDDVLFVGGTLWTDMNKFDPLTLHVCQDGMNDYNLIRNDEKGHIKLRAADTVARHRKTLEYIRTVVDGVNVGQKVVVVGHHAPSKISTKPQYERDVHLNGAYSTDLSEFILDRPQIKLWTHGHTHHEFDYMIGSTRIVCNPRGYVGYERGSQEEDPFTFKTVEI